MILENANFRNPVGELEIGGVIHLISKSSKKFFEAQGNLDLFPYSTFPHPW